MEERTLEEIIGKEALEKLSRHFGGERIYIPAILKGDRDERIMRGFELKLQHGSTCMNAYQELAQATHLSVRRVQGLVNKR